MMNYWKFSAKQKNRKYLNLIISPQMLPHLLKVFENIKSLKFDGDVAEFMVSSEGEEVPLKNCVCKGEVEDWMRILEESMKYSI